jgi:hypothetical protein
LYLQTLTYKGRKEIERRRKRYWDKGKGRRERVRNEKRDGANE